MPHPPRRRRLQAAATFFMLLSLYCYADTVDSATAEGTKLERAAAVLTQLATDADPAQRIAPELLARAQGLAVIPNTIRGGFLLGGRRGRGVLVVRGDDGRWSSPSFITLTAGSIGWQIGAESADIVLVFGNRAAIENIEHGKFELSGDITAVAGPDGSHSSAPVTRSAEVYAYVRGRGLFAGAAFEGARIGIDGDANARYYANGGGPLAAVGPATPASTRRYLKAVTESTAAAPTATPPEKEGAKIYPLGR